MCRAVGQSGRGTEKRAVSVFDSGSRERHGKTPGEGRRGCANASISGIVRSGSASEPRRGKGRDALHVLRELVQLVHVRHRVDVIQPDVVELLALVFGQRDGRRPRHVSVDLGTFSFEAGGKSPDRLDRTSAGGSERARPARRLGAASRSCAVTEAIVANARDAPASAGSERSCGQRPSPRSRAVFSATNGRRLARNARRPSTCARAAKTLFLFRTTTIRRHERPGAATPPSATVRARYTGPVHSRRRARRPPPRFSARCPPPRRSRAPRPRRMRRRSRADSAGAAASEAAAHAPRARRSP